MVDVRYDLRGVFVLAVLLAVVSAAAGAWFRDPWIVAVSVVLGGAAVLRIGSPPPPTTASRWLHAVTRTGVNVVLFALMLGLSVLAAEGLARWVYRDVTTTAAFRGYFTNKWLRSAVRTNHYGFRGGEFDEVKTPGIYRVAVLGDSFTFGNGVPEAARFSDVVGAALRARRIEVLNFGEPGNNWPEHTRALERRILRLKPDYVLLQWGVNDVELDRDVLDRPRIPAIITDPVRHEAVYRVSALYTILNAQWNRYQLYRFRGETYPSYMRRKYLDPQSEGAVHADQRMRQFIAACRRQDVGVGVLLFPDAADDLGAGYPYEFLHERVQAICRETGIECVDLRPRLAQVPDRRSLWASPLDSHPSILANRIAADAILETFATHWGGAAPPPARP